jgi:hypothetical protein
MVRGRTTDKKLREETESQLEKEDTEALNTVLGGK